MRAQGWGCRPGAPPLGPPRGSQALLSLQTQPVPNPLAYFLHRTPWWVHRFETLSNHFLELLVPFFLFLGRRMCILHGLLQILFQVSRGHPSPAQWPWGQRGQHTGQAQAFPMVLGPVLKVFLKF